MVTKQTLECLTHTGDNYVFTRMQNIVWKTSGLGLAYIIEKDAGDLLGKIVSEHDIAKPLVINFCRITEIDDHALDGFFDTLVANPRQIIILKGNHLFSRIESLKKGKLINTSNDPNNEIIILGTNIEVDIDKINIESKALIQDFKEKSITNCLEKFDSPKRLSSTPIKSDGEFNSNKLISDIKAFMWLSTFLADELSEILDNKKIENIKLLSASLRGAPFTASIGLLLNLPFETVDHFGPKHKVFDREFLERIEKGTNYFFIGDFSIGGTEIKIAKTYTEMKGCFLNHALVIGNYIESEHFNSDFQLWSLCDLKKLNLVNYTI